MEIVTVIGIALVTTFMCVILKQTKPEVAIICAITGGIIILTIVFGYMQNIISIIKNLVNKCGIDSTIFTVILKIIGIGYLTEFSADICNDAGCSSIADKVIFAGKILILIVSLPIITGIIDILSAMLP